MQEYNLQRMLDGVDKDTSYMYNLMLNFTVPKCNRSGDVYKRQDIRERFNPQCQRNLSPKWDRKNRVEVT